MRFGLLIGIGPDPGLGRRIVPGVAGASLEINRECEETDYNGDHKNVVCFRFSDSRCRRHQ